MTGKLLFNNKAFTLIEVLVSLAILGLVMVPLLGFFLHTVTNNQSAREQMEAGQLAQEVLEGLKSAQTAPASHGATVYPDRYGGRYAVDVTAAEVNHVIRGAGITPLDISGEDPVTILDAAPAEVNYVYNGFSSPAAHDRITIQDDRLIYQGDMFPALASPAGLTLEMRDSGGQKELRLTASGTAGNFHPYTPAVDGDGNSSVTVVIQKNSTLPLILQVENHATGNVALHVVIVRGTQSDGTNYPDDIATLRGGGSGEVNITKSLIDSPRETNSRLFNITVRVSRAADNRLLAELQSYKRMP